MAEEENSGRWALHCALAWILGRSGRFVQEATPTRFSPTLSAHACNTLRPPEDVAWAELHRLMTDTGLPLASHTVVRIRAFGRLVDQPDTIELAPELIAQMDWGMDGEEVILVSTSSATIVRDVTVPIGAVTHNFPATGLPMLPMDQLVGPPQDPNRPGSIPLSSAAYWIATTANPIAKLRMDDREAWQSAYADLRARIVSGEVRLIGRPKNGSSPEMIPGTRLSGLEIELRWTLTGREIFDSVTTNRPRIYCVGIVSEDSWIAGDSDEVWGTRYGDKVFTHLEVMSQDIARLWAPACENALPEEQDVSYRTGSPGRPTKGRGLIVEEFNRRCSAGECEPVLAKEAQALRDWFTEEHRRMDPMASGTIENAIRKEHRKFWVGKKKPRI